VLLALLLTNDTLNMMSMIGVIMLMGLVTKNAILLVDNANERRALGATRYLALVEAGQVRLRPIMMTTLAMIFGMVPIAMGMGEGGGFRAPMARAVIGGLITSTLLTLVVVPVAYTYFDDFGAWVKRRLVGAPKAAPARKEEEHPGLAPEPVWGD
jgi:HAE1 family hydrophobic/amphiphilic exporter-1